MGAVIENHYTIIILVLVIIILALFVYLIKINTLIEKYKNLADKDAMTGVYNRVSIEQYIDSTIDKHPEQNHAMLVIDIDNFKRLNDSFGHPFGDKVIDDVAGIIRNCSNKYTRIGRLGGDEFAIFISGYQTIEEVKKFAEDIKCKLHFVYNKLENSFNLTVSIGIAIRNNKEDRFKELYQCADLTLYKAKNAGRNCVAIS